MEAIAEGATTRRGALRWKLAEEFPEATEYEISTLLIIAERTKWSPYQMRIVLWELRNVFTSKDDEVCDGR